MSQQTLSDYEYGKRKRTAKREEFLEIMEEIIPWEEWVGIVRPQGALPGLVDNKKLEKAE